MKKSSLVRIPLIALLLAAGTSAGVAAQDRLPPPAPFDLVVTIGEAVVKATPDQAFVTLTAEQRSKVPRDAQQQNAAVMTAVQQKLRGAGVPADAIRTISIELTPEFDFIEGRQRLRGYLARNTIEVRVDALERLGEIIDLAVNAGATNVTGVRFDVKRRDELQREALKLAVAQARARAEAAAAGAGRSLDRVVRIEEEGAAGPPPPRPMMMARAEMAADAVTPVAPGELEIRARVTLSGSLR